MEKSTHEIKNFILEQVSNHPRDIVSITMQKKHVTRTTVLRHIRQLIKEKLIFKTGNTKNSYYAKSASLNVKTSFSLMNTLDEFQITNNYFTPGLSQLNKNIVSIAEYGLTEMINNVIDHSQGKNLIVEMNLQEDKILLNVKDDGIGIFKKIATLLNSSDNREAVLQLNKGKFTSDRFNHTGEGIFFCSRIFDEFTIIANGLNFTRYNPENDWFLKHTKVEAGTTIKMIIDIYSDKNLKDLFLAFQDDDSLDFNKTEILVALSKFGSERYISRSQAKRILKNLDVFKIITLDFKNIATVGQGFVDQVFRVYQSEHPKITIKYINANEDVLFMIERGLPKVQL